MTKKKKNITPPENLYCVKVTTDWRYGKRARFWEIQKFNQEASDKYGEVVYYQACKGGLAYTNWGLWYQVRRRMKKMKVGNSRTYYNLNREVIKK